MPMGGLRLPQITATIGLPSGNPQFMTLTFEDFRPGPFGSFGPRHVTREEMLRVELRGEFLDIVGGEGERSQFAPLPDRDVSLLATVFVPRRNAA
jgi:hypothetical protein